MRGIYKKVLKSIFTSGYTISREINENRGAFYDETGRFNGRITTEGSDQD